MVKNLPAILETQVQSLGWEDVLEKGMTSHSSILAWRISQAEEPGGLSPWGLKESVTTEYLLLSLSPHSNSPTLPHACFSQVPLNKCCPDHEMQNSVSQRRPMLPPPVPPQP